VSVFTSLKEKYISLARCGGMYMPVIPATREVEAAWPKFRKTLSQKQYKQKGWEHGSSGRSLGSVPITETKRIQIFLA
jgi:hypothetical protein